MYIVKITKDIFHYAKRGDYFYARDCKRTDVCYGKYMVVCVTGIITNGDSQDGFGVARDEYEIFPCTNKIDKLIW